MFLLSVHPSIRLRMDALEPCRRNGPNEDCEVARSRPTRFARIAHGVTHRSAEALHSGSRTTLGLPRWGVLPERERERERPAPTPRSLTPPTFGFLLLWSAIHRFVDPAVPSIVLGSRTSLFPRRYRLPHRQESFAASDARPTNENRHH